MMMHMQAMKYEYAEDSRAAEVFHMNMPRSHKLAERHGDKAYLRKHFRNFLLIKS